jgi:hypothetical protein
MARISMAAAAASALAVLALSAATAGAGNLTVATPKVNIHLPPPKVDGNASSGALAVGRVVGQSPTNGTATRGTTVHTNGNSTFVPKAGNQVLVGFEHGDPSRPYVIGSVASSVTRSSLWGTQTVLTQKRDSLQRHLWSSRHPSLQHNAR